MRVTAICGAQPDSFIQLPLLGLARKGFLLFEFDLAMAISDNKGLSDKQQN
jgi:hypothetical protein